MVTITWLAVLSYYSALWLTNERNVTYDLIELVELRKKKDLPLTLLNLFTCSA